MRIEKLVGLTAALQHVRWWHAKHAYNTTQLVVLGRAGENGQTKKELGSNAPKRPHVDGCCIW